MGENIVLTASETSNHLTIFTLTVIPEGKEDESQPITYSAVTNANSPFLRESGDPDNTVTRICRIANPSISTQLGYLRIEHVEFIPQHTDHYPQLIIRLAPEVQLDLPTHNPKTILTPGAASLETYKNNRGHIARLALPETGKTMSNPIGFSYIHPNPFNQQNNQTVHVQFNFQQLTESQDNP